MKEIVRLFQSISKSIKNCLQATPKNKWPENYSEVFGALFNDESFKRPPQSGPFKEFSRIPDLKIEDWTDEVHE